MTALIRKALEQKDFQLAAAFLSAMQACGKYLGIVENQQIAGIEKIAQLGEMRVDELAA